MTEHDEEPIPGLPGVPPPGERILWQGSPDRRALARTALHARAVAAYFGLLALVALASGGLSGAAVTVAGGATAVGLLNLFAWAVARSTVYTLTNRRVVIRTGVAIPKCLNIPLALIGSVALAERGAKGMGGTGDVVLATGGEKRIGWLLLWPHVRPWRFHRPEPMLRALPDAAGVAARIGRTCLAAQPHGALHAPEAGPAEPALAGAMAA